MKKRILLILLAGVMLMAMLAMTFTACGPKEEEPDPDVTPPEGETIEETVIIPGITPDYPVPEEDENAEDSVDDDDKMQVPEGSTGAGMEYTTDVTVELATKNVNLYFRNPSRSLQNMTVQLVIQDQVLAESGLIVPGKQLCSMVLKQEIPAGVYENGAKLVVRYYDPTTGTCSVVTSEILVKVTAA